MLRVVKTVTRTDRQENLDPVMSGPPGGRAECALGSRLLVIRECRDDMRSLVGRPPTPGDALGGTGAVSSGGRVPSGKPEKQPAEGPMAITLVEPGRPHLIPLTGRVDPVSRCRVDAGGVPAEWGRGHGGNPSIQATLVCCRTGPGGHGRVGIRPLTARLALATGARLLQVGCRFTIPPVSGRRRGRGRAWRWLLGEGCEVRTTAFIAPLPTAPDPRSVTGGPGGGAVLLPVAGAWRAASPTARPSSSPLAGTFLRLLQAGAVELPAEAGGSWTPQPPGPSSTATPTDLRPVLPSPSRNTMPHSRLRMLVRASSQPMQDVSSPSRVTPAVRRAKS